MYFLDKNKQGFTLIELLVAIGIIGVLSTLSTYSVFSARAKAKEAIVLNDIAQIQKAIDMLANDTNFWPGHQEVNIVCTELLPGPCPEGNEICGLDLGGGNCVHGIREGYSGIIENDTLNPYPSWGGPYMNKIPLDPWGQEYFFDTDYRINADNEPCNGELGCMDAVVIGSYGPNGTGYNLYNSDDIIKVILR